MKTIADIETYIAPVPAKSRRLSVRERILVLVTALVLIGPHCGTRSDATAAAQATQTRAELTALEQRITAANQNLEEQILQLAGGGNEQRRASTLCVGELTKSTRRWATTPPN